MIALDRQERGQGTRSAAQEVAALHGLAVGAIVGLADIVTYLEERGGHAAEVAAIGAIARWGV